MKRLFLCLAIPFAALTPIAAQAPPPQEPPELLTLPTGEKLFTWQGHTGRSYFLQVSDPTSHLEKWFWAPVIEGGADAEISYEVDGTADKGFFRIHHTDQVPGVGETLDTADFDGDGISNVNEISPSVGSSTNPLNTDTDGDGLPDGWEIDHGLDPNDSSGVNGGNGDPDHDGLTNLEELALGTDPNNPDTDGDGISDGSENDQNTDPNDAGDTPKAEWFILTGDLDEDVEKSRSRTVTIPAGKSRLLVVALASEEYPYYTGEFSEFNDTLEWEIRPSGKDALNGSIDVNSRHDEWDLALVDGTEIQGFSPAHIEEGIPLTAPGDEPLVVEIDLSATNVGDGTLPSTVMVGLLAVEVQDNIDYTGVDDVSKTADAIDNGYVEDFWIMAPLQGPARPNGAAYENLSRISIGMGENDEGELTCANATPNTDPAGASQLLALDGEPHDVMWQGLGNGIDSEETVKIKINGGSTEFPLPVKVKTMKYRTVTLRVYLSGRKRANDTSILPDPALVPTEAELETYLNQLFAYQINTWFDVSFAANTEEVDWGGNFFYTGDPVEHSDDQNAVVEAHCGQGGLDMDNYDMHLFLLGHDDLLVREDLGNSAKAVATPELKTAWVLARPVMQSKQVVLETIGHELGHIFFGSGHPDDPDPSNRGVAPLLGTNHTVRLMSNTAGSRLTVKKEWDKAEVWLKGRERGDQ